MEQTLVLVKPDGVQRGLIGEIVTRLERRGLKLMGMKFMQMTRELASAHYEAHVGKPFYDGLVSYITSGPIVAMVWEGNDAIQVVRPTMGATNAANAAPEWRNARDQYLNHVMACRACYAPTARYCLTGADLRASYENTPMEAHP